jgi:hypothetical protein
MKVTIGQGTWAEGNLKGELKRVISQIGEHYPNLVIEMGTTSRTDLVTVTLDTLDLYMIVRLAKESSVEQIRDAVRWP